MINLYPELEFETLEGFGGAITDSAAYIYSLMNEAQKKEVMDAYFSPERMGYTMVRIHMDSCDFSTELYEAMSDPADVELKSFSFARTEKYIIPMLMDAERAAGKKLELMLSPWSPPAFMKTNGSRVHGGSIKPEYRAMWAEYICRYIEEFKKRGFHVRRMSLQNEPNAVQTWDSCVYTAEEEKEFLKDYMYPAIQAHGWKDLEIFIWDHNKDRVYERAAAIIDSETDPMVTGAAFHWYSGEHFELLEYFRKKFPDKKLILSESCIELCKYRKEDGKLGAMKLAHEIIGDLNRGVTAFYDWNLLLDENGGPNHVGNFCNAPFLYDTQNGVLMPQLIQPFYEHFSHYLVPGSVRIGYSRYTDLIEAAPFRRPDGSLALILLNKAEKELHVHLRLQGRETDFVLPGGSITTALI